MAYEVYKITNKVNNKIYIGRTIHGYQKRFEQHIRCANRKKNNYYIHRAMNKYGVENFYIEKIAEAENFKALKDLEGLLIKQYKSYFPEIGYNLTVETSNGTEFISESTRAKTKIGIHKSKKPNPNGYGIYFERGLYIAAVMSNYKKYSKSFKTLEEAKDAYDRVASYFYREDAMLNFPEKRSEYLASNLEDFFNVFRKRAEFAYNFRGVMASGIYFVGRFSINGKHYNCGKYETAKEAAFARDIVYYYLTNCQKFLNFKDEILDIRSEELDSIAEFLIRSGCRILADHPAKGVRYRHDKQKYVIEVGVPRAGRILLDSLKDATIAFDKISFYLNGDISLLNNQKNIEGLSKNNLKLFYRNYLRYTRIEKTSKFIGVSRTKNGSFISLASENNKNIHLSTHEREKDAAILHDKIAWFLNKDIYQINFPKNISLYEKENLEELYFKYKSPLKLTTRASSSRYRGVYRRKDTGMWSFGFANGKTKIRKDYHSEDEAANNYDFWAFKYLGHKAKLNFPEKYAGAEWKPFEEEMKSVATECAK